MSWHGRTGLATLGAALAVLVWLDLRLAPDVFGDEAVGPVDSELSVPLARVESQGEAGNAGNAGNAGEPNSNDDSNNTNDSANDRIAGGASANTGEVSASAGASETDADRVNTNSTMLCTPTSKHGRRVHFERGSAELDPEALSRIDRFVQLATPSLRNYRVVVEGHTDRRGTVVRNQVLSLDRAKGVADRIRSLMENEDVEVQSFAAQHPIAPPGAQSRWRNRRVVLCLLKRSYQ